MNMESLSATAKVIIRKPPLEVYTAFANASEMSKFWFTRRDDGLREGQSVSWFVGEGDDAFSFDVRVKELDKPNRLVIEWENGGVATLVTWQFEETEAGDTILSIEESGFTGTGDAILERVLDSTGGFNQVIIAAKAVIEHGVELNVVADHA